MNFRRYYVPNAIVFITQVVHGRKPVFRDEAHIELLRATLRRVKELHPFSMLGYVLLPDHFHLLIITALIKGRFLRNRPFPFNAPTCLRRNLIGTGGLLGTAERKNRPA